MPIEIPGAVQWLTPIVVGADWPEGDEDALRRLAEAWTEAGDGLESVLDDTESFVNSALQCMQGETADAFEQFGSKLTSDDELLSQLRDLCEQLGQSCDDAAMEIEYTKLSIIAALLILAAQIAAMLAAAAATVGGSTAGIPVAQAATQLTVKQIIQQLLATIAKNIAQSIVVNVGLNVGVDAAIQGGQMLSGNRDNWDGEKTGAAAKSGVAAGIAGGAVGSLSGPAPVAGAGAKEFTQAAAYGAGKGALEGSLGAGINNELQGNDQEPDSLLAGAVSGVPGGVLGNTHDLNGGIPDSSTPGGQAADAIASDAGPTMVNADDEAAATAPEDVSLPDSDELNLPENPGIS
ncbi:hypothetical protein IQ251_01180 [Saccharopolyspora sp. HNM0983]|uniref:Outer membrane channel protein CpnT-like N-terminal domain-containing protein n=1 Tax=Saccharopolyspora montiporae TaxID=2781240 RepID=A0A929B6B0_9PSEU|nr:hypothetical protein [Saccharopolyspora sp. HNM0983]MBE9373050.1 hypothetical protein [Saccharopolyspora sp. HNM0983]